MVGVVVIGIVLLGCLGIPLWIIFVEGGPANQLQSNIILGSAIVGSSVLILTTLDILTFKFIIARFNAVHDELFD